MQQIEIKRKIAINKEYDTIIIGGGPSGCAAAIAAARNGSKTLLVEATGTLGGMGTAGLVPAWCYFSDGKKMIYRGIAEQVFNQAAEGVLHEPKKKLDWVHINPEHLKVVYDRMVKESGAHVLFFTRLIDVEMQSKSAIDALLLSNKQGITAYRAKLYIDCTGDGDLAAWAGASYNIGDEYGKLQAATHCFSLAGVDTYSYLNRGNLHASNKKSPIHAIVRSGKYPLIVDTHMCQNVVSSGVVQFNAGHLFDINTLDTTELSEAMPRGREIAQQMCEALREYAPEAFGRAFVTNTAQLLGVREGRRIEGDYTLTLDDFINQRRFDDEIGRNSYYVDIHKHGSKSFRYKPGESHGIPYRILTPKGLNNLLVAGRCNSTDDMVYGSMRVMPTCLVTGEAAGTAAAMAIRSNTVDVHQVDTNELRQRLKAAGQYFL